MEDEIFENFWRLGKQDYSQATLEQKTALEHALLAQNSDINHFCLTRPGMVVFDVLR